MPPSGPGTIYPFADKSHFESTYRTICTHKNISLDLSHLVLPAFSSTTVSTTNTTSSSSGGRQLDLHQLHFLVFKLGGEVTVNEKGLWGDVAERMGLLADEINFSPNTALLLQRPFATDPTSTSTTTLTTPTTSQPPSALTTSSSSTASSIAQHLSRVYKLYLTFFDQAIRDNITQNRARAQAAMQATQASSQSTKSMITALRAQQQKLQASSSRSTPTPTPSTPTSKSPTPSSTTTTSSPLQTRTQALIQQQTTVQNRAAATAQAKAAHLQAQAIAVSQAHVTHTLIPRGIPLMQFLTQHVGLSQSYVDSLTTQERFMLMDWTLLSEADLKIKTKGKEGMIGVVKMIKETLKEMKGDQRGGAGGGNSGGGGSGGGGTREHRLGFTTSVAVGIVLPGMNLKGPGPPSVPPPSGPVPPIPRQERKEVGRRNGKAKALTLPQDGDLSEEVDVDDDLDEDDDGELDGEGELEELPPSVPSTRFISSGLKGEPLPPPEPKMGSAASFEVVYRLMAECNITEASLDKSMDSIVVPAERLPEHHALLDKVSQACAEIDTKLAMIHDVLQQENYIKRMIIIASQIVYQKTLLTKVDWERRYVLTVDMLKSMLAEIQYLVGLYNQSIRGLMDAFQTTASAHGHDAAVSQLPSWVQVQLQQQAAAAAAAAQQQQQPEPSQLKYRDEDLAFMDPQQRAQARMFQRAQEADLEMRKFREGFQREGPEEVIRWIENRCRPLKNVYEEYLEQKRLLLERLREREKEMEEEEEERRYSAMVGRRRWSLRDTRESAGVEGIGIEDRGGDDDLDLLLDEEDGDLRRRDEESDWSGGEDREERTGRLSLFTRTKAQIAKSEWSAEGELGLPFTEEEHAAAVLFVQCATQEFGSLPATAQMLSWDTDLTPEEKKEYHRLHDRGYRQYQEYGPRTALLHLLMGQDSTTKRFIVIGYVLSYQQHVFATGTKRYILTLDQLEEWVEDYADIIEEFIERKNEMHREQVETHLKNLGRERDLGGIDIGALIGKKGKKHGKKKKKDKCGVGQEEKETEEEMKMVEVLGGVVDFLEMYRTRM